MRSGFRSSIFDPVLVVAQIVSLFCFHCVALGGWLLLANLVGGTSTTIDQLFDYHGPESVQERVRAALQGLLASELASQEFEGTYDGWLVMGAVSLNSFTTALIMWKIVRRAKQCLDFAVTLMLVFLLVCLVYGGLPWLLSWWLTHLASTGITALTAEYLCMRTELAAIPLSAGSLART